MSDEINRINPTVVEGAEDIHGAETFDADYSPLNRPAFSWRDNMAQSRRTLDDKQVGDMVKMRRMGRGRFDAQGYNDRMDESMGMSRKETKMEQSMKDRRDESKGMEKGMGRRAYQRVGTMDAESIGSIIGNLIPEPHFIGFEEIRQEKMKNQNTKDAESFEAMEDVIDRYDIDMYSLMTFMAFQDPTELSVVKQAIDEMGCDRDTVRWAINWWEKAWGGVPEETLNYLGLNYDDYNAEDDVDILYERWKDGELTDEETLSLIDILDYSYSDNDGKRLSHMIRWIEDENSEGMNNLRIGIKERFGAETFGAERRYRYGNRYITRDSKGRFKKNVDVGRSLSADRRQKAKIVKGVGQGGSGDYKAESFSADILYDAKIRLKNPKDAKYITPSIEDGMEFGEGEGVLSSRVKTDSEAEGFGAEEYKHCDGCEEVRSIDEFSLSNDPEQTLTEGEVCDYCFGDTYYGAEGFNTEETMLGSIGEGNDFGQMEAEEDYYTRDATFVCPESDCGCRGCYGCMGEDENPNCRCCGYVFKDGPTGMGEHTTYQCSCGVRACDGCIGEDDPTCPSCGIVFVHTTGPFDEQGNYIGSAEGDVVDLTQGVLAKGGVRVGGMTASAIVLAIAGMSGYYYARR